MQEYDATLKGLLTRGGTNLLNQITGLHITEWRNIELPEVRIRRTDLLGETADGELLHVEVQSSNDPLMAVRMLEYALSIRRQFQRFPHQVMLYAGRRRMKMNSALSAPGLNYECRIFDLRELNAEELLNTGRLDDQILAILGRLKNKRETVRRILASIATADQHLQVDLLAQLSILGELRDLGHIIKEETQRMPIDLDIRDNYIIGPLIKEAAAKGLSQGERRLLLRMIDASFGPVPSHIVQSIESMTSPELERIALNIPRAKTLDELFK